MLFSWTTNYVWAVFVCVYDYLSGILRDKTMDDIFICIQDDTKQLQTHCRFKLFFVQKFGHTNKKVLV